MQMSDVLVTSELRYCKAEVVGKLSLSVSILLIVEKN